jgi:hypothetical protein
MKTKELIYGKGILNILFWLNVSGVITVLYVQN